MRAHSLRSIPSTTTTDPRRGPLLRAAAALTLAVASMGAAHAAPADELKRVEISGRKPGEVIHTNVRATCPGIADKIGDALARKQFREGKEGVTTVSFRLSGSEMSDVTQRGGPRVYRSEVYRAMRNLECRTDGSDQLYVMQISFSNAPAAASANGSSVALLAD
ncbi:MAG: hypothetical protein ABW220_02100 [Burkholderiaceae bacterium]